MSNSKEARAAYARAWRAKHPGANAAACRRWRESNPEGHKAAQLRYWNKITGQEPEPAEQIDAADMGQ